MSEMTLGDKSSQSTSSNSAHINVDDDDDDEEALDMEAFEESGMLEAEDGVGLPK